MNWLLKIVEGPLKGAEVALVDGRRVSLGSDDACDIVVGDAALAAQACELDVSGTGVTVLTPDGAATALKPFEVRTFGTTAFAVGPVDQPWGDLVYPPPEAPDAPVPAPSEPSAEPEAAEPPPAEAEAAPKRRHGCLGTLLVLLLLLVGALALLHCCRASIEARCPQVARFRAEVESAVQGQWGRWFGRARPASVPVAKGPTLPELAAQHGLALVETNGVRQLAGNVRRRTERLAIRALALADDPSVQFNLTDDETLRASADELLFVVTEGALKATAASNRVVTLAGYAPSAAKLERALRALAADVPGIERVETKAVQVGGPAPAGTVAAEVAPDAPKGGRPRAGQERKRTVEPIAGILMHPYPCVVLRTGLRLAEGAQIGTATIVRIEADRLILRDGKTEFAWRP